MSCENTTLHVYVSTLSGTSTESVGFTSLAGTVVGSVGTETQIATAANMAGTGSGSLTLATVPATAAPVSGTMVGSFNTTTNHPAVVPTGELSGTFSVIQEVAKLYDFTGIAYTSAAGVDLYGTIDTTAISLTGDTVAGRNYRNGETVTTLITAGTLSTVGTSSLSGEIIDEYVEGTISTELFVDANAYGTLSRDGANNLTGTDVVITLTAINTSTGSTAMVTNYPYDVHTLSSITVDGGVLTSTISGESITSTITSGTLSSTTLEYVLTGANLASHVIRGQINTALAQSIPVSATMSKTGNDFTASSTNVDGTLNVPVPVYVLSSIPVNGAFGVNPGSAFGSVSGKSLMEVISTGVISSTNVAILTSTTVTNLYIEGTVNTPSMNQAPVEGLITSGLDGSYSGELTAMTGILNTAIDVYQLSSIPLTGSVSGSVSGESTTITLTSGTVSSTLPTPYILTTDSVTNIPITGIGNGSINITGTLSSTGQAHTLTIDTADDQTINVETYVISSFSVSGGSVAEIASDDQWTEDQSLTVNITGGTLSGIVSSHMLTSESLTVAVVSGTLDTDYGTLTATAEINTFGNHLSGDIIDIETVTKDITLTPVSSLEPQYIIETAAISSSPTQYETLTATISGAGNIVESTINSTLDVPLSVTGSITTNTTAVTSLLSGEPSGNFYTLYGGGMASGAGNDHSMTNIPITAGTLTGVSDCLSITRSLTGGTLSSTTLSSHPLSGTLSGHDVDGYGYTNNGETVYITGYINKPLSGSSWSGILTSVDGSSTINEDAYRLDPIDTVTGTVTGDLSGVGFFADITSSLLSSTTLSHLLTCSNTLSSHSVTGTITTQAGTVNATGTIDTTTSGTYTGVITAQNYPVSIAVNSLSSITLTEAEFLTETLSGLSGLFGTLSSTTLSYLLTSEFVSGHYVEGTLSNAEFDAFPVTGYITTNDISGTDYTVSLTGNPLSSYVLTASVISSFPRKELNIGRGNTYTFVLTTPWTGLNPFRFSTTQDGVWSIDGEEYTVGVAGNGSDTPGDEVKIKIDSNTPDTLYYYNDSVANAGGRINITAECSVSDDSSTSDTSTSSITEKQNTSLKGSDVKFIFNKKELSDLELYDDTKYTFFVNNSTGQTFSFNDADGNDASLGSPRNVSNNRTAQGAVTFAKQTNMSIIGLGNQSQTGATAASFQGSLAAGPSVRTSKKPAPNQLGFTSNTNITNPPGALDPKPAVVSVDCEAPELYRGVPPNTVYRMPIYSRTRTSVYNISQSRTWEYPTWTFNGTLTSIQAGSTVTFTSEIADRDPTTVAGTGTLSGREYIYTWSGTTDSGADTLEGNGISQFGINSQGGQTGAVYGTWDTRYSDIPYVSGTESWSLESTAFTATALSSVAVTPTASEYKSRKDYILHNIFTTENEPLVVSHGERYNHPTSLTIGPFDNDVTLFTGSEIWTNGQFYIETNRSGVQNVITPTSTDAAGNVIARETILASLKIGDSATLKLSGTDGMNLWGIGVLSYIENVCMNTYAFKNITVSERNADGDLTINNNAVLNPTVANSMSAVSGSELALTIDTIPSDIPGVKYRWSKELQYIPGAIAATLNFSKFTDADEGDYYIEVETPYKFRKSEKISITAHVFTQALAAAPVDYSHITTFGFAAGKGHMWAMPQLNVQIWQCVTTGDGTLDAVYEVASHDMSITPYNNGVADVLNVEGGDTPTFNGGVPSTDIDTVSADPLNWHFSHSNSTGQRIAGLSFTGVMDNRKTNVITHNVMGNNNPWNHGSDAPSIVGTDIVYLVLLSSPLTGENATMVTFDGGESSMIQGDNNQYTHFITQSGYKGPSTLTATSVSGLEFTVDTLTGAPTHETLDYVFGFEPWSHHLSASHIGLSGNGNIKVSGIPGLDQFGNYYTDGYTVSALFKSLSGFTGTTFLTSTSTYAVTGDVIYPDTTFHISTKPVLEGSLDIDVSNGNAFDSPSFEIDLYELAPYGIVADNNWRVTRKVCGLSGIGFGSSDFNAESIESVSAVFHPDVQSLSANTTDKVRYLYMIEYDNFHDNDGVDGAPRYNDIELDSVTIQYTNADGTQDSMEDAGEGETAPSPTTGSIANLPAWPMSYGSTSTHLSGVIGLSASSPSIGSSTSTLSAVQDAGEIHFAFSCGGPTE